MHKKIFMMLLIFSVVVVYMLPVLAIEPSNNTIYRGIDVSEWQGEIDFERVKEAGIEIVYIRAGQGFSYKDPDFERNYAEAKRNELKVGVYHYMTARTTQEARQQAQFFVSLLSNKEIDCKLAMDFESFGNLSRTEINEIALEYIKEVERLSTKEVIVYSNTNDARNIFSEEVAEYPLWVAQYGVSEPSNNGKWNYWEGFQYSSSGRIDGIRGDVDLDRYTEDILLDSNEVINNVENPNITKEDRIVYKIRRGDTLTGIARKFNTTISHLAQINNIKNPNLIYTGEIITISHNRNNREIEEYDVKRGDTLTKIAREYNTSVEELVEINKIRNPDLIYVGEKLRIYK